MATVKKPKMPKAPKASASIETLRNHCKKLDELTKSYRKKIADAKKADKSKKSADAAKKAAWKAVQQKREAYAKL